MPKKLIVDGVLLHRFFHDQCTEEERRAVLDWLSRPENVLLAGQAMRRQWDDLPAKDSGAAFDMEEALRKTQDKIRQANRASRARWGLLRRGSMLRLAAVLTGAVVLVISALMLFSDVSPTDSPLAGLEHVSTTSGEIVLKVLDDGTRIWLNAESSVEYPATFSGDSIREVFLRGEAFFDVAEDKEHPFIVRTKKINIRVLGTAFNVKSYDQDPTIETTLVRGKVVIDRPGGGPKVELRPNQQAVFTHSTDSITLHDVAAENQISWNRGSLVFEDDSLYDVIRSLERWYGITIHVEDQSNMSCRLTARIDKESLVQTLETLRRLAGITYSISGKEVFIKGKICNQ